MVKGSGFRFRVHNRYHERGVGVGPGGLSSQRVASQDHRPSDQDQLDIVRTSNFTGVQQNSVTCGTNQGDDLQCPHLLATKNKTRPDSEWCANLMAPVSFVCEAILGHDDLPPPITRTKRVARKSILGGQRPSIHL